MKSFKDLQVWEKSHRLTLEMYKFTGERLGLLGNWHLQQARN
jgi:hypothetical protein